MHVIICYRYLTFPSAGSISTCIPPISICFDFWLVRCSFSLGECQALALFVFFDVRNQSFLICFKEFAIRSTSSAKRRLDMQFSFFFRHTVRCPSPFRSKSQCLSPLLIEGPSWKEGCSKDHLAVFQSVSTVARWSACNLQPFSKDRCIAHW